MRDLKIFLEEVGYYANQLTLTQLGLELRKFEKKRMAPISAILLEGPPGVGKTYLAKLIAKYLEFDFLKFQFTEGTGTEDILYDINIENVIKNMNKQEERSIYLNGVLPESIKLSNSDTGVVLLLDEFDKASPKIDAFLLDFLESGEIYNPHLGKLKANINNLFIVITKNDERDLSEPLMRRLRRIYLDFLPEEIEINLIVERSGISKPVAKYLVNLANKIRFLIGSDNEPIKVPSAPELISCAEDLQLVSLEDKELIGEIVISWLLAYRQDHEILKKLGFPPKKIGGDLINLLKN